MVRARILRLVGAALVGAGAFTDWTSSTDLGHDATAVDIPLAFLWTTDAVSADVSLGHVLVALALVALISIAFPLTGPVALGAGLGSLAVAVGYGVRFAYVTNVVDPTRVLGVGIAAVLAGGVVLVTSRG